MCIAYCIIVLMYISYNVDSWKFVTIFLFTRPRYKHLILWAIVFLFTSIYRVWRYRSCALLVPPVTNQLSHIFLGYCSITHIISSNTLLLLLLLLMLLFPYWSITIIDAYGRWFDSIQNGRREVIAWHCMYPHVQPTALSYRVCCLRIEPDTTQGTYLLYAMFISFRVDT